MSKEDTASGLLSKMVKFVRNPATSWSDLDSVQADRDDSVSKQLLKEMIERKRQNDFVRKREFDLLRKMRKREAMVGVGQDMAGRPSFFQSSMPSRPDDRASTLKKIDEIEAQMSMQWWKTKSNNSSDGAPPLSLQPAPDSSSAVTQDGSLGNGPSTAYRPTVPAGLQSEAVKRDAAAAQAMAQVASGPLADGRAGNGLSRTGNLSAADAAYYRQTPGFSPSRPMLQVAREAVVYDTELEEAAIRFANGDDAGAEAGLLEILAPGAVRDGHQETWLALFDLYRATGAQDKFEVAAIHFVERFDRSAPQWFSMPDIVNMPSEPAGKAANGPVVDWVCPSVLGIQTLAALKAAMTRAPMPWRLDWSNLKTIEPMAVEPLNKVFSGWAAQPVQLRFMGDAQLQTVLQNATQSGNRNAAQSGWLLRMEALRVTHRPDDFELAALDFCVTYEVSPPAWENACCEYKPLDAEGGVIGGHTIMGEVYRDSLSSGLAPMDGDMNSIHPSNQVVVELSGEVQGDVIEVLDKLNARRPGVDIMLISCPKLIRVDFSAAGTILNWVSACEAENRRVQFLDVNRLVVSFFNIIGITEHARVIARTD